MSETDQLVSISEFLEKMRRGDLPDFRTWRGSDAERAMHGEAEDYLVSVGIDPRGKCYNAPDVIRAKRQERQCAAECDGGSEAISACPTHGYKPLLRQYGTHILTACAPCPAKMAVERQFEIERLVGELPARLKAKSFENFKADDLSPDSREAFMKTREAVKTGESLVLAGNVGTGKTHLAAALLIEAIHERKQGLFRSVPSLMKRLRSFGPMGDYQEVLNAAIECGVLVLDDLGAEKCTDWVGEQLYMIVNERYIAQRQTVVTTNFPTPSGLIDHLGRDTAANYIGQRIVSRLCEMGAWVTLRGADRRIQRMPKPRGNAA